MTSPWTIDEKAQKEWVEGDPRARKEAWDGVVRGIGRSDLALHVDGPTLNLTRQFPPENRCVYVFPRTT